MAQNTSRPDGRGGTLRLLREGLPLAAGPRRYRWWELTLVVIAVLAGGSLHLYGSFVSSSPLSAFGRFDPPQLAQILWLLPIAYAVLRFGSLWVTVFSLTTLAFIWLEASIQGDLQAHLGPTASVLLAGAAGVAAPIAYGRLRQRQEESALGLAQAREWLGALHTVTDSVTGALDKNQLLGQALVRSLEVTQLSGSGAVFLLNEERGVLELEAHRNLPDWFTEAEREVPLGECLCGLVAQSGQMIYSPLDTADPRHTRGGPGEPHSHVIVPLQAPGAVVGVMCLYLDPKQDVSQEALDALNTIGHELGIAVENLRLLEAEKKARIEAQAAEVKFRNLFENALDGIIVFDIADGRVLDFNAAALDTLGMTAEELRAASLDQLFRHDNGAAPMEVLRALPETLHFVMPQVRFTRGEGKEIWLEVVANTVDYEGRLAAQAEIRDITARVEGEKATAARAAEQEALARFSATIITTSDLQELAQRALATLTELTGMEVGAVLRVEPSNESLEIVAHKGMPKELREAISHASLNQSLSGSVIQEGRATFVSDVRDTPYPILQAAKDEGLRSQYVVPLKVSDRLVGALNLAAHARFEEPPVPVELLEAMGSQLAMAIVNAQLREAAEQAARQAAEHAMASEEARRRLEDAYMDVTMSLVLVLEARDPYTRGHSDRVAIYSRLVARQMGLEGDFLTALHSAAHLHDLGKIGISDDILHKARPLDPAEWAEMHRHPARTVEMVRHLPFLEESLPMIRSHHERWDGQGYPDNLAGEDIPLGARILAVADAYDAMTTERPYRKAFSHHEAVNILRRGAGTQWDPQVVEAFVAVAHDRPPESYPVPLDEAHERQN